VLLTGGGLLGRNRRGLEEEAVEIKLEEEVGKVSVSTEPSSITRDVFSKAASALFYLAQSMLA